jgi:hypothetical protein
MLHRSGSKSAFDKLIIDIVEQRESGVDASMTSADGSIFISECRFGGGIASRTARKEPGKRHHYIPAASRPVRNELGKRRSDWMDLKMHQQKITSLCEYTN